MTPLDRYVASCIKQYPSLYSDVNFHKSKMKVLGQLLNVIGNGINDDDDLERELHNIDPDVTFDDIKNYIDGSELLYGYYEVETYGDNEHTLVFPKNPSNSIVVPEPQKHLHPDVVLWNKCTIHDHIPYPNFKKDFSTIYECPSYLELDSSFIFGAIEYYEYCLEFFDKDEKKYHGVFPTSDEREDIEMVENFITIRKSKYKSDEQFSKDYGDTPYTGNMYEYLCDRWNNVKKKNIAFIHETLDLLRDVLNK